MRSRTSLFEVLAHAGQMMNDLFTFMVKRGGEASGIRTSAAADGRANAGGTWRRNRLTSLRCDGGVAP